MAAMPSVSDDLLAPHSETLLQLARRSIEHGLDAAGPLPVDEADYPPALRQTAAAFVTLHRGDQLRGCIGSLEPHRTLIEEIVGNAYAAAFRDPRFSPLQKSELADLHIEVSVLTPREQIASQSEADVLDTIRPGIDGVVLEEGSHRATFLPAVWEQLPDKVQFISQLKLKAGLTEDYWSAAVKIYRYQTVSFAE